MQSLRWIDRTQPQTLMIATIIMYINAALGVIQNEELYFPIGTFIVLGSLAAGLGIANEKKWGYWLGVVVTGFVLAYLILHFSPFSVVINLLFAGALLALLLHPHSRSYQRTWFK